MSIDDRKQSFKQHVEIFNAIKNRDPQKARLAMHEHLNTMELRLKKM